MDKSLLRDRRFVLYLAYRLFLVLAMQMQSVAVAWQVYEITHSALHLGYVGLAIFLPTLLFALPGGKAADLLPRRNLMLAAEALLLLASLSLYISTSVQEDQLPLIYLTLVFIGIARSFGNPSTSAYLPQMIGSARLPQAVAMNSTVFQLATISGPALAGLIFAWGGGQVGMIYAICGGFLILAIIALLKLPYFPAPAPEDRRQLELLGGLRFIWKEKLILGAITIDLFAVLLGGAVALLPIFARDILHVGPEGLGYLRSAPAVGAALMAIFLGIRPLERGVGRLMFMAVTVFGIVTIIFGLSTHFLLSLACLVVLGASDMISVVIRQTLIQTHTPNSMRGRVAAVNMVFIGASNELGEFESGITANYFGTVPAVVMGGLGTCLVVLLACWFFPALRRAETFRDRPQNS